MDLTRSESRQDFRWFANRPKLLTSFATLMSEFRTLVSEFRTLVSEFRTRVSEFRYPKINCAQSTSSDLRATWRCAIG